MHDAVLTYLSDNLPVPCDELHVLEFGSRNINGSARQIVGRCARYVGVDLYEGPDVDVVGSATDVVVPGAFDVVICTEVFEHADDAACQAMTANAYRHLVPGGRFIATMAGPGRMEHSAIDGKGLHPGEFYRNVDKALLAEWLAMAGFDRFDIDRAGADMRCVAWKGETR